MEEKRKLRRILMWAALALLIGGLVWAIGNEAMQANKDAQSAASIGANDEMATIEMTNTVKPKNNTNIDWATINKYERQLKQNTAEYQKLIAQAGAEKQAGPVSPSTKSAGIASANKFNQISEQLAAVYQKGNCVTKAKAVRAAGKSRVKNADMAFNELSSDMINNYNDERSAMSTASDESLNEDKVNGSSQDLAKLKAVMLPRLERMASDTTQLLGSVMKLIDQIRSAAGGDAGAIAGCAKSVVGGAADGPAGLLKPMMSLVNMLKNMGGNLASTMKLIASL